MNERIRQLKNALEELEGSRSVTLSECLYQTLRLIELCPWLQEGDQPKTPPGSGMAGRPKHPS